MTGWRLLACVAACSVCVLAQAEEKPGLTLKDGRLFREGHPYRGVGCNYFDLFLRVLNNPDNTTSLTGLERLAEAGIPFVRFSGPYSVSEWRSYRNNKDEYFRRFDRVVRTAEKNGIGLIPSLFWTLSLCEIVGESRDQWGNPQSKTLALMRQYTGEVVGRYKNSPAIWAWEFGNEVNLVIDLPNAAQFRPKNGTSHDDITGKHLIVMLSEFTKAVRAQDAARPVFSGNSHPRAYAWHNTSEKSWKPDTAAQTREILLRDNPEPLGTIGIHFYGINRIDTELGVWPTNRLHYLTWLRSVANETRRPIFIGEFGLADQKGGATARPVFEAQLAEMEQAKVDLAAFWVFDRRGGGGGWSVSFDNDRAYMIALTAEANRRWNLSAQGSSLKTAGTGKSISKTR